MSSPRAFRFTSITVLLFAAVPALAGEPATLDEATALAGQEGKPVLIDFWAAWCRPCKAFNKDLAADPEVQAAADRFVLFRTDAEREGKDLAEKFMVSGFPTYVVLNREGKTLNRWAGYTKEQFLDRTSGTLADMTTFEEKLARWEENPTVEDARTLAVNYDSRGEYDTAIGYYRTAAKMDASRDHAMDIFLATYYGYRDDMFTLEDLAASAAGLFGSDQSEDADLLYATMVLSGEAGRGGKPELATPYLKTAIERTEGTEDELGRSYRARLLPDYALRVEKDATKAVEYKKASLGDGWTDDPRRLNSFAWWCFEQNVNLEEGYAMAKRGVELSEPGPDRAMILDTQAELCNAMGDCHQALTLIRQAIQDDPAREAYRKQEERFLELVAAKEKGK